MSSWNRIDNDRFKVNNQYSYSSMQPIPKITHQPTPDKKLSENGHRFAGLAVGLASIVSEHIFSHPCVVLRRQCQVHNTSTKYHLTPLTLFPLVFNLQRHQSLTCLWKGLGSSLIIKGIFVASEAALHEITGLPRNITNRCSFRKLLKHMLLKGIAFAIITPFKAAALVETVQSEIASERPGVLDCLYEGASRIFSLTPTRLLPIWKLILPTALFGLLHYSICSLAHTRVAASMKDNMRRNTADDSAERSLYEEYYPEIVAIFTGNLLADTILYPFETILHRLYLQGTRTIIDNTDAGMEVVPIMTRYEGVLDCYTSVVDDEGFSGLYKGFGALILQYGLHIAILKFTRSIFELVNGGASDNGGWGENDVYAVPDNRSQEEPFGFTNSPIQPHRYDPSLNYPTRDPPAGNFQIRDRISQSQKP